jgi:hypothetical protein
MLPIRLALVAACLAVAAVSPARAEGADATAQCAIERLASSGALNGASRREADEFPSGLGALRAAIGSPALAPCRGEAKGERDAAFAATQAAEIAAASAALTRRPAEATPGHGARAAGTEPAPALPCGRLPAAPPRRHLGPAARPMEPGPAAFE